MADKDMLAFLAGLLVEGDTITLDGEPVCFVLGHTGRQVSTVEAAAWIAEACNQASRTCATCAYWQNPYGKEGWGHCRKLDIMVGKAGFCHRWQDKEAADAE